MEKLSNALPAYLGGKRRLAPVIFALLATRVSQSSWPQLTFVDPFLGGGSIGLLAKAYGFEVQCNDVAYRSALVGHALIANSSVTLSDADAALLFREPEETYPRMAEERFSPSVFSLEHARFLDRGLYWARSGAFPDAKRHLVELLLVRWALRCQPMSQLRGTDARAAAEGDFDRVSPRRVGHYVASLRLLQPRAVVAMARQINGAVFPGRGFTSQMDAVDFLGCTHGDVVYLDPPYPGTTTYEKEYRALDILRRVMSFRPAGSAATQRRYRRSSRRPSTSRPGWSPSTMPSSPSTSCWIWSAVIGPRSKQSRCPTATWAASHRRRKMRRTGNTSSSPRPDAGSRRTGRLARVPFDLLRPHPANANVMDEERLEKLATNIAQEGNCPPLVVRPHPTEPGCYQVLDGHQRWQVLKHLRHQEALCYVWPCDDHTALVLLATLNRLEGQDDPLKRAELLRELTQLASPEDLAQLLPESAALIRQSLELLDLNLERLLADLQRQTGTGNGLRAITFVVSPEDEQAIEEAVQEVVAGLEGANRRGRALAQIAKTYTERWST